MENSFQNIEQGKAGPGRAGQGKAGQGSHLMKYLKWLLSAVTLYSLFFSLFLEIIYINYQLRQKYKCQLILNDFFSHWIPLAMSAWMQFTVTKNITEKMANYIQIMEQKY